MAFQVVKSLNNNAVLVQKPGGSQIVLMSKGVGFGKKPGDLVEEEPENQKVFYILDSSRNENKLRELSLEKGKVEQVTREIVGIAEKGWALKMKSCTALCSTILRLPSSVCRWACRLTIRFSVKFPSCIARNTRPRRLRPK